MLVFADPWTGEEFDGALEEAERRRRITQDQLTAERERATAAEERVRTLEERLRNDSGDARPLERDS